ncbi:hypothetical protein LOTGIDRAFT_155764 [Lottia gigantea]|uniref:Homeobox domain-containing protein n=1 Tax=Lottia gigantea TaxID=225164 RepID=V3ZPG8_LOTGI|nr:hypothetical protein LOTGIDRAFT_155764 [Lottia gigantea]ESO82746.1 hypothetical protein LOTGIDRAFT_155764 [Lottia gigantea]
MLKVSLCPNSLTVPNISPTPEPPRASLSIAKLCLRASAFAAASAFLSLTALAIPAAQPAVAPAAAKPAKRACRSSLLFLSSLISCSSLSSSDFFTSSLIFTPAFATEPRACASEEMRDLLFETKLATLGMRDLNILERIFQENHYPDSYVFDQLCDTLNLDIEKLAPTRLHYGTTYSTV